MAVMVKVRDRKRPEIERLVTTAAYAAKGPKVYEKLAMVEVDAEGNEIGAANVPNSNPAQVSRSVKGAVPVVVKSQLVTPKVPEIDQSVTGPDHELTLESTGLNAQDTESSTEAPQPTPIERKKPGPKPGTTRKKSISSNSDTDEK